MNPLSLQPKKAALTCIEDVPTREEMNNEEVIDKAPTAREVIERAGGKIAIYKGVIDGTQGWIDLEPEQGSDYECGWSICAFDAPEIRIFDAIIAAAYSQFRSAEDAKWEEIECCCFPDESRSGRSKDDEREFRSACGYCKGTGKLYRRINSKEVV